MFIRRTHVKKAIELLGKNKLWPEVEAIARKNIYVPYYGVGGMLYRNLIASLYDCSSTSWPHDYDFLVMGEVRRQWLPVGWIWKENDSAAQATSAYFLPASGLPASGHSGNPRKVAAKHSATALHITTGIKVDLVSILDIMEQQDSKDKSVGLYFSAVPLNIQRIAYDFKSERLWGEAIDSIVTKTVRVNNSRALDIYKNRHDINEYGRQKTSTLLGFKFLDDTRNAHDCMCDIIAVWNYGCSCGGFENEMRRKSGVDWKQGKYFSERKVG